MADDYSVKINAREGALEVTAPDRDWVDGKLDQLSPVYTSPLVDDEHASRQTDAESEPAAKDPARSARGTRSSAGGQAEANGSSKTRRARSRSSGRPQVNPDLEEKLTTDVKESLRSYIDQRRRVFDKSQPAQAAIIATFLQDALGWEGINEDDLVTVYRAMGERPPKNLTSQLVNARQRAKYFSGVRDGRSELSFAGDRFARHDALDTPEEAAEQ
jgi:hypothetical protein